MDGMAAALENQSCDLVGLARTVVAEPLLPREMMDGKKVVAKENFLEPQLQIAAGYGQLREIGEGKDVSDYSIKAVSGILFSVVDSSGPSPAHWGLVEDTYIRCVM